MPIYEYECPTCGCRFEIRQGFDDRSLIRCPKCKTVARKLISVNLNPILKLTTDRSHEKFGPRDEFERDT